MRFANNFKFLEKKPNVGDIGLTEVVAGATVKYVYLLLGIPA